MHNKIFILLFLLPLLSFGQELKQDQIFTFEEVAQPPLAKTCKRKKTIEQQRDCTAIYIHDFVNRHFDTNKAAKIMKKAPLRLQAQLIINSEGKVSEVKATGGPEELNSHLQEILLSLKDFQPAMQDGKAVKVSYTFPVSMRFW